MTDADNSPMDKFAKRDRVRIKRARPLPNGRSIRLIGMLDYLHADGRWDVRIITPGLYGGGIFKCTVDEIERI